MQDDRSAFHHFRLGDDLKHLVHARGPEEVERHRAHDEGKTGRLLFGRRRGASGVSNFNIAHCAMIDDFSSVHSSILGRRLGYLPNAHAIFAGGAQRSRVFFGHDAQTRHCGRLSSKT
jgi:hypothetical protein